MHKQCIICFTVVGRARVGEHRYASEYKVDAPRPRSRMTVLILWGPLSTCRKWQPSFCHERLHCRLRVSSNTIQFHWLRWGLEEREVRMSGVEADECLTRLVSVHWGLWDELSEWRRQVTRADRDVMDSFTVKVAVIPSVCKTGRQGNVDHPNASARLQWTQGT